MAYRRKKRSTQQRLNPSSHPPTMNKSKSAPYIVREVDWPGSIDDKYIEDVKNRLDVIEQTVVSDDMIRAFLAANEMKSRHAVEALKKCVEWRKGRQMFWNNYRSQNERFQFLTQIRKVGSGMAATFGHTKNGRLLFYEKIGENFNIPLYKEFTQSEFIDHVIVWCENLLNYALANAGKSTHLINEIPYYDDDGSSENKENPPITPNNNNNNDNDNNNENDDNFPETDDHDLDDNNKYKKRFKKFEIRDQDRCKFTDCVGIIDWKGVNIEQFIANKQLLIVAEKLLSEYYPHLINRLYHINMPLNFEKIENALKSDVSQQILMKSIFLESLETKQKRIDYMKKHGKPSIKSRRRSGNKKKNNKADDDEENNTDIGNLDEYTKEELLKQISSLYLPTEYGGDIESSKLFTFVDPIYRDLVGVSSEPDPSGYEEFMNENTEELKSWKQQPLRSLERHTQRISVKRGQHYLWQFNAEFDRKIIFGVTFEAEGFRGKAIKIIVREEVEQVCGYCPMFGDFIVLKDGNLIFQFRNTKGAKRINLQYKIESYTFPKWFINKHLPDYHAEERFIQSKTLNIGGKNHHSSSRGGRSNKSPSEYSGSTAISTSPPPDLFSLRVNGKSHSSQDVNGSNNNNNNNNNNGNNNNNDEDHYRSKLKKAKSQRSKKSTKKKSVKKKKSKAKRAKTPEPHTPVEEY